MDDHQAAGPRRLGRGLLNLGQMSLETLDEDDALQCDSPLQLMSPNVVTQPTRSPGKKAGAQPAAPRASSWRCAGGTDAPGALPTLATRTRRPDARRQSTAIFSAFEHSAFDGAGLLGGSELAIGDEELLVPLSKASAAMCGANAVLYVDPDNEELLEEDLPQPVLQEPAAAAPSGAPARREPENRRRGGGGEAAAPGARPGAGATASTVPAPCASRPPAARQQQPAPAAAPAPKAAPPPPAARPSRLRPPSSSTSYFSNAVSSASR
jgi:hypothetical protein